MIKIELLVFGYEADIKALFSKALTQQMRGSYHLAVIFMYVMISFNYTGCLINMIFSKECSLRSIGNILLIKDRRVRDWMIL